MAVAAALAAMSLLVTLVVLRRDDVLGVGMALLVVLLTMTAGVAVSVARHQQAAGAPPAPAPVPQVPGSLDADTLETLDDPMVVAALRARLRDRPAVPAPRRP